MIGGRHRVEVPDVVRDVLVVAHVLAGIEIDRDQAVGVQVVARANRAVEVRRRIADHEVDAVGLQIDRRILPDAAAERLVGIADAWQDAAFSASMSRCMSRPVASLVAHTPLDFSGMVSNVQSSLPSLALKALTKPRMPYSPPLVPISILPSTTVGAIVSE